jgi:hypothetical protein
MTCSTSIPTRKNGRIPETNCHGFVKMPSRRRDKAEPGQGPALNPMLQGIH